MRPWSRPGSALCVVIVAVIANGWLFRNAPDLDCVSLAGPEPLDPGDGTNIECQHYQTKVNDGHTDINHSGSFPHLLVFEQLPPASGLWPGL
jgi:hypothetical protein